MKRSTLLKVLAASALPLGAAAAYAGFVRPWHLRWGASNEELTEPLPGDEIMPDAEIQVTHAITVNAPASEVWKWLLQIGQGRGGFYSYDEIENLFGLDIHNLEEIRAELQQLKVGDFIRSAPTQWLGGRFRDVTGWFVVGIESERYLVLSDEIEHGSWAFVLQPAGVGTTRLIARVRGPGRTTFVGKLLHYTLFEPAHFVMERKMLLTLKRLSEMSHAADKNKLGAVRARRGDGRSDVAAAAVV
jgi:hypothetical protein